MTVIKKDVFFEKYFIDNDKFDKLDITWGDLNNIFKDYVEYQEILEPAARTISEILRTHPEVHSVRSRVKNPEHLIEKIIRKSIERDNFKITLENYKELITDLIGIRVLHLYKDQAQNIDSFIQKNWDLKEPVTIYYRKGDYSENEEQEEREEEQGEQYNLKVHPAGYRSWHYLIKTKLTKVENIAEVQVRTIFEEGWSEIDHQLRYPYDLHNTLLRDQLLVLNRVAGSADEMASTIRETKNGIEQLVNENQEYKRQVEELYNELEEAKVNETITKEKIEGLQNKVANLKPSVSITSNALSSIEDSNYLTNISDNISVRNIKNSIYSNELDNFLFKTDIENPIYKTDFMKKHKINLSTDADLSNKKESK